MTAAFLALWLSRQPPAQPDIAILRAYGRIVARVDSNGECYRADGERRPGEWCWRMLRDLRQ